MKLTFSPALGQTTNVKVTPVPSHISGGASHAHAILFKATFDSYQSYLRAQSDKFRVELWTNLPVHSHGRHGGEWRAVQFTELEQIQGTSASAQSDSFSLLTEADGKREENTLYLRLQASLQDHIGARFSYTFRLVHASGHVEWLGSHGNNGMVVVEEGIPGISLSKDWLVRDDGKFGLGASPAEGSMVRLDKPEDWSGWVWKPSRIPMQFEGSEPCEGRAMVLLPRPSSNLGDALKPLVLVADESSSLRLTVDGDILVDSVDSSRRATLGTLERSRDLLDEAVALCNGSIRSFDSTSAVIATRQSDAALPYHVVVLPVMESLAAHSIPLQKLWPLAAQAPEGHGFVLFSPRLRKAKVLKVPPPDDSGFLYFGPSGGDLIVSPVHVVCENDRAWQVTLLAPSKEFTVRTERSALHAPPTPPPSPPTRDSLAMPAVEEVVRADQSVTDAPRDNITRASSTPATSSSNGDEARHFTQRRRLSLARVRTLPARLIRAYLHAIFNAVFWFWSVFFKAFAARLVGEGISQVVTRFLGFALSKTAPRSARTSEASTPSDGVGASDATRASQHVSQRSAPQSARETPVASHRGTEGVIPNSIGSHSEPSTHIPVLPPRRSSSGMNQGAEVPQAASRVVCSASLLPMGLPLLAIVGGQGPVRDLRGTLNGKLLPAPSVTPVEDDVFLVEFACLTGEGELEVSFEL